ncbi:MAG TPA: hypothetical protein VN673_07585, partial [Clostridia bacterium]|nr:hypothetical protein [Clostridia bacterium]
VVVLAGLVIRLRSAQRTPSDYYVLGLLVLFSLIGTNQQTRYLMPAGPFLISYGFVACRAMACPLARWMPRPVWPSRLALAAWLVVLSAAAVQLLAAGNLNGTHRGLCYWASPRAESFYRGYWLDLYRACRTVKNDPTPGKVAVLGGDDKYVTAFTGRPLARFGSADEFVFLLVLDGTVVGREQQAGFNLECVGGYGSLVLYKRSQLPHSRQLTAYENH